LVASTDYAAADENLAALDAAGLVVVPVPIGTAKEIADRIVDIPDDAPNWKVLGNPLRGRIAAAIDTARAGAWRAALVAASEAIKLERDRYILEERAALAKGKTLYGKRQLTAEFLAALVLEVPLPIAKGQG
jgi:hypothetical protein